MRGKFQKFISLSISVIFLTVSLFPLTAKAYLDTDKLSYLIQNHKQQRIEPMGPSYAKALVLSSNNYIASIDEDDMSSFSAEDYLLFEKNVQRLKAMTDSLQKAVNLSERLAECSEAEIFSKKMLPMFTHATDQSCNVETPLGDSAFENIEETAKATLEITEPDTLKDFINESAEETISDMFNSYWAYKGLYGKKTTPKKDDKIPAQLMNSQLKEVFGDQLNTLSLPLKERLNRNYEKLAKKIKTEAPSDSRENMIKNIQAAVHRIKRRKNAGSFFVQRRLNTSASETLDSLVVDGFDSLRDLEYIEGVRRTHPELKNKFSQYEWRQVLESRNDLSQLVPENFVVRDRTGQHSLTKFIDKKRLIDSPLPSELTENARTLYQEIFGDTLGDRYFGDFLAFTKTAPIDQLTGVSKDQLLTFSYPMYQTAFSHINRKPSLSTRHLEGYNLTYQKNNPLTFYDEIVKNPLLYAGPLRNIILSMDAKTLSVPKITEDDLDAALEDQQSTIKRQLAEVVEITQHNSKKDLKEDLKILLKQDPYRVLKKLSDKPEMVSYVCAAYQDIKVDADSEAYWDNLYFWGTGGLLLATLAATGVGLVAAPFAVAALSAGTVSTGGAVALTAFGASAATTAVLAPTMIAVDAVSLPRNALIYSEKKRNDTRKSAYVLSDISEDIGGAFKANQEMTDRQEMMIMDGVGLATGVLATGLALKGKNILGSSRNAKKASKVAINKPKPTSPTPQKQVTPAAKPKVPAVKKPAAKPAAPAVKTPTAKPAAPVVQAKPKAPTAPATSFPRRNTDFAEMMTDARHHLPLKHEGMILRARKSAPKPAAKVSKQAPAQNTDHDFDKITNDIDALLGGPRRARSIAPTTPTHSFDSVAHVVNTTQRPQIGSTYAVFSHTDDAKVVKVFQKGSPVDWEHIQKNRQTLKTFGHERNISKVDSVYRSPNANAIAVSEEKVIPLKQWRATGKADPDFSDIQKMAQNVRTEGIELDLGMKNIGVRSDGTPVLMDVSNVRNHLRHLASVQTGQATSNPSHLVRVMQPNRHLKVGDVIKFHPETGEQLVILGKVKKISPIPGSNSKKIHIASKNSQTGEETIHVLSPTRAKVLERDPIFVFESSTP